MPGGEFFFAPVESSASGVITFSEYPAVHEGEELEGIRLEFDGGKVVSASAKRGEDILNRILDRDEGARRIGELGIGCNPGITRYMKNTLFDEKIDGSIHLALGQSYTFPGRPEHEHDPLGHRQGPPLGRPHRARRAGRATGRRLVDLARVALATCAEIPDLEPDDRLLLPALAAHGIDGVPAVWDDSVVEWDAFDLVVLRSTWDYAERRDEFLAWARSLQRVENPVPLLEWNTDKRYLEQLAAAGVPTVPTRFVAPGEAFAPPAGSFVVKPSVSAGGRSSARFGREDADAAHALVAAIHAQGRTAMIQPYLSGAEEKALVYVGGEYSHALLRRVPLPAAGSRPVLYLDEELAPAEASAKERTIAEAALACAPGEPLYARVDLLGGAVLELELTEPSLYFELGPGSAERLAAAISRTRC